jgi:hypothetical protein
MLGEHVGDQSTRSLADTLFDPGHHLRGECPVDDGSQPLVPRIIEGDHRADELGDLWGDVAQRHTGRSRAEDFRVPAGVVHIVISGQRPVPGTRLETGDHRGLEELDRRFPSKRRERPVAEVFVHRPEVERTEVDVGERDYGGRSTVVAARHPRLRRCCHRTSRVNSM